MRYTNVTEAREDFLNIVKTEETVTVTKNGRPAVVIVPFDDYEELIALKDALRDPAEFGRALESHRRVQQGIPYDRRNTNVISSLHTQDLLDEIEKKIEKVVIQESSIIRNDLKKLEMSVQRIQQTTVDAE